MQKLFEVQACLGGYEVIDVSTGRPIGVRHSRHSANGVAQSLNRAALAGPKALAKAISASPGWR